MTGSLGRRALACAASVLAMSAAARAGDPPSDPAADDKPRVEGDVRAGWRFLSGEGDGRFQQDIGLKDGLRLFDLNALATNLGGRTPIDEAEAHFDGVGDRNSDYLLTVRRRDVLDVSGGYRRDDSVYSASGDLWPYDTLRERSFVHATFRPDRSLTLRLSWDRTTRRGDAETGAYSTILPNPTPPIPFSDKQESLPQSLRFDDLTDDFTFGADYATGIWRFGLTQAVRLGQTDDSRTIAATAAGQQLHDDIEQSTRLKSYATTGKAGVVLLGGKLDATLFVTHIQSPLDARANGDSLGIDANGAPVASSFHTDSDLRREAMDWRLESSWRPHPDWEFAAAAERGEIVDDESVDLDGSATFATNNTADYRITDRTRRFSGDVTWDATESLRLRAGEQYLYEDLFDPTNSHFNQTEGTRFSSASWRSTLGAEWTDLEKVWSVSVLGHHSTNDEPQTTPVADYANDWSVRGRWRSPSKELTTTALWRHVSATHHGDVLMSDIGRAFDPALGDKPDDATDLGSATRTDTFSWSAAWTHAPWTVTGTGTYRRFDTSSDTAYPQWSGGLPTGRRLLDTVSFSGRDVVANLDVRYEITKTLRAVTDLTGTDASGDYEARWLQLSLGGEYDLRADLTLGATVSTWRLNQQPSDGDNYRTYGAEVSLTYRF